MTLGDDYREEIEAGGRTLTVQPLAVEPVSDIAVLGAVDSQQAPDQADTFEAFCDATAPVVLYTAELPLSIPVPAHVFTHDKGWIRARVTQCAPRAHVLWLETEDTRIEGGSSGGPVVTDDGRLLGVVSQAPCAPDDSTCTGMIPV